MQKIIHKYRELTGNTPDRVVALQGAVSTRRYFRISQGPETVIGTISPDVKETIAFLEFSGKFRERGILVPEVFAVSEDKHFYLQTDLGDQRLHELVAGRSGSGLNDQLVNYYHSAICELVKMQFDAHDAIDYSVCVPRPVFDRQSVLWDLNHFKYYFLKTSGVSFDEYLLEEAFIQFADLIGSMDISHFMFRDFQTRNIMIHEGSSWLIDFQGGRKGPLQYDLASLVYEAKASLSSGDRQKLIDLYFKEASVYQSLNRPGFMDGFYKVALVRLLQALGAYGLRGIVEKKAVFLQSIPPGLDNLGDVLGHLPEKAISGYFRDLLEKIVNAKSSYRTLPVPFDGLTITVYSFSYRKPLPDDLSGNGGGFVYDCRFLENPGKKEELRLLNGLDMEVQDFLEKDQEVERFLDSVKEQAKGTVNAYLARGYRNLMIAFGCTGGQHRSVYLSHRFAKWCRSLEGVRVLEIHRELNRDL